MTTPSTFGPQMAALEKSITQRLARQKTEASSSDTPGSSFETLLGGAGDTTPETGAGTGTGAGSGAGAVYTPGRLPSSLSEEARVEAARRSAENFESFFISQMLQPMFANLGTEAPFGGGHAESVWRSLLVDEYGKMLERKGGLGITDAVMKVMLKNQEA
ncbi:rod-binding protein [Pararhodospirillum photometricum]|nr:rod-binding protein [Pararhodospirillum photometricum]